jgi:nucleotide-binding universal stress UspA family protein
MEIRTILAALSGGGATSGVMELACRLAHRFESHVEALHVQLNPNELAYIAADGFGTPVIGDIIEVAEKEGKETAAATRRLFDAAVGKHGVTVRDAAPPLRSDPMLLREPSATWRTGMGYSPVRVAERARLFDLLVLGRSGRVAEEAHSSTIEEALLTSGRPVLVAPAQPPDSFGENIAIAWNDSPESARALGASMPFLARARTVHVLTLGDHGTAALVEHCRWYGIDAVARRVPTIEGVGVGELLLAAARDAGADLLVMGGYGKAPWREALFGGATRHVVGTSLLPLLLAH